MKKRKQKALKYLGLSIVCFGLHACSIFLEPFAVNSENKVAAGGYILGVLFWVTLLAGAVLFGVCREIISKTAGYQEWKQKKIIGVWILPNTAGTDHGSDSAGILRPYYRGKSDGKHPGRCSSGSYGDHVIYFLSAHDSKWQSLQIYDNE